jgi:nitrogen fixation protein FixH
VQVGDLQVLIGRVTVASQDIRPAFARRGDGYEADLSLARGKWMVKVTARSGDGTLFEQRAELFVRG